MGLLGTLGLTVGTSNGVNRAIAAVAIMQKLCVF